MTAEKAMQECPKWAKNAVRIVEEDDGPVIPRQWKHEPPRHSFFDWDRLVKRYGIIVIGAALFCLYTIILSYSVHARTVKEVRQEMAIEYASKLEEYKREQAEAVQAEHWLSGAASRDAAINQAVDAVAPVIAKLANDQQKQNEVCCMIARHMNPSYPGSFEEIAEQAQQWPLYDGKDRTYTQHDWDLAEALIRPYMESGIVPNGLTMSMVYGEWTPADFVLRDSYKTTSTMHTFHYTG